jgi:hypothetical protein
MHDQCFRSVVMVTDATEQKERRTAVATLDSNSRDISESAVAGCDKFVASALFKLLYRVLSLKTSRFCSLYQ